MLILSLLFTPIYANVSISLSHLLTIVNKQLGTHPDCAHIIAGDFNQTCLKTVLPGFYQHVNCATRGQNILEGVYSSIHHACFSCPPGPVRPPKEEQQSQSQQLGYYNSATSASVDFTTRQSGRRARSRSSQKAARPPSDHHSTALLKLN